jgi:hypothetical protein
MKKTRVWLLCCAGACLLAGNAFAQVDQGTPRTSDRESGKSQFCKSKDLVGANIKDSQGQKVGDIKELFLNPQNSQTFASVDVGKDRHALVPVQALTVTPSRGAFKNAEVTINKTKADLESAPSVKDNEWSMLDDPSFTKKIYSHFNIQPPSAVGGTGASSGATTGAGSTDTKSSTTPQP